MSNTKKKFYDLVDQAIHDLGRDCKPNGICNAIWRASPDDDLVKFVTTHTRRELGNIQNIGDIRLKILDRVREILHAEGMEVTDLDTWDYDESTTFRKNFRSLCEHVVPKMDDRKMGHSQIYASMLACAFGGPEAKTFNMAEIANISDQELYRKLDRLVNECVDAFMMMQPTIARWNQEKLQKKVQKYLAHCTFDMLVKILFSNELYINIYSHNEYDYKVYGVSGKDFPACGWIVDLSNTPYYADIYYAGDGHNTPRVLCRVSYEPDSKLITIAPISMSMKANLASPRDRSNPIKGINCYGYHPINHLFECLDIAETDFHIHFDEPDHIRDAMRAILYTYKFMLDCK